MAITQDEVREALTWSCDRLDSPETPVAEAPYFDKVLDAWVLTRTADIQLAFRTSSLILTGFGSRKDVKPFDDQSHRAMRSQASEALAPAQLHLWSEQLERATDAQLQKLPREEAVDLIREYARPLCLLLAAMATGVSPEEAQRLAPLAGEVSAASAEPSDPALKARAKAASTELRSFFPTGPEALRDSGFVALSQTMPSLLGNAWFALVQHPEQWQLLHDQPTLADQAVEELLRYAGLARVLFRVASEDLNLNGTLIQKNARLVLRIVAGNRDESAFPRANRLDITRRGPGHLTLGVGTHACVGANLIRMTIRHLTVPLVTRFARAALSRAVEWRGGSGFGYPDSLWVELQ